MAEEQKTLADLKLTKRQMEIMLSYVGNENMTLEPSSDGPNPYWRLVDGPEPSRLGLLRRRKMQGGKIGFRLTARGKKVLTQS